MNEDKELQQLFDQYQPTLSDSQLFMNRLERKLEMIDEVRQAQAAELRHYRWAVVVALLVGIVIGGGLLGFLLHGPANQPLLHFNTNFYPLLFLAHNSHLIAALFVSLMMAGCFIALLNTTEHLWQNRWRSIWQEWRWRVSEGNK